MNQCHDLREYILDTQSEKKYPQWDHSGISSPELSDPVVEKRKQFSEEVAMCTIICTSILSFLVVLQELEGA